MLRIVRPIFTLLTILSLGGNGCDSAQPVAGPVQSASVVSSRDAAAGNSDSTAQGFDTPDAALDAYGKALVDGDGAAYRMIIAKDAKALNGFNVILQFEKGMSPEEAAKINLPAIAPNQGFGNAVAKRFPVEVTGDKAVIVQVFERRVGINTEAHFRKFKFSKSGGKWYFVGSEFGEASELPAKYAWNNEEQPQVAESPAPAPMSNTREASEKRPDGGESRSGVNSLPEIELFNGADLSGWNYLPMKNSKHRSNQSWFADPQRKVLFSVAGDRNELATIASYRDFELKLQWRWRPDSEVSANGSGVVVRVDGRDSIGSSPKGLEIDLRPQEDKEIGLSNGTFIAYNVSCENHRGAADGVKERILGWLREPAPIVEEQWNDLHIVCIEDRVTVTLNNVVVNEGWKLSAREGKIVLRNQNAGVEFRNIRLTEIQPRSDVGAKERPSSPTEPPKSTSYRSPPKAHPEFRDLAVESHDCRVFFPGKPNFTEKVVPAANGNVHIANFQGKTARATYMFEIYTYPKTTVAKTGARPLLEQTLDSLVDAPTGRIISREAVTYQDSPAIDFVYEHPDVSAAGQAHSRVVMRGNRVYLLEVSGSQVPPADINVFFDSLAPFGLPESSRADSDLPNVAKPKRPLPGQAARDQALQLVREIYLDDFRTAKSNAAKISLAEQMIARASEVEAGSERFVLLDVARKMASGAGGVDAALDALTQLEQDFEVASFLLASESLEELSKARLPTQDRVRLAGEMLDAAQSAVAADRYDIASRLIQQAAVSARSARELKLADEATAQLTYVTELGTQFDLVKPALESLQADPDDADANLLVGQFYGIAKGQWDPGLTHLAKGSDATLKTLATLDLAGATTAEQQFEIGDQWYQLAMTADGMLAKHPQLRAAFWYEKALPNLTGLEKALVEKRLSEMEYVPVEPKLVFLPDVPMLGAEGVVIHDNKGQFRDEGLQGEKYPQVLWAHADDDKPSHYAFTLNRKYSQLTGKAAINDVQSFDRAQKPQVFSIYGDHRLLWTSRALQNKRDSQAFSINVSNVKTLHFYVAGGGYGGHALWVDVALEEKP